MLGGGTIRTTRCVDEGDNTLIYLFTVIYMAHFPYFNAQMRCTGYEMARYKGTQASHLYEKSMHTLCTINEQPLLAEASTIPDRSLSHTYHPTTLYTTTSCTNSTSHQLFIYLQSFIWHIFHSSMLECAVKVMRWRDTRAHRPAICTRNRCTHYVQSVSNRSLPNPQLS